MTTIPTLRRSEAGGFLKGWGQPELHREILLQENNKITRIGSAKATHTHTLVNICRDGNTNSLTWPLCPYMHIKFPHWTQQTWTILKTKGWGCNLVKECLPCLLACIQGSRFNPQHPSEEEEEEREVGGWGSCLINNLNFKKLGAGEMAQKGRVLLCKHENLNLNSQPTHE